MLRYERGFIRGKTSFRAPRFVAVVQVELISVKSAGGGVGITASAEELQHCVVISCVNLYSL